MKVRRYFAVDMRAALAMVREQQGPDVIILSNRRVDGGVEILTAVDGAGDGHEPPAVEVSPPATLPAADRATLASDEVTLSSVALSRPEPIQPPPVMTRVPRAESTTDARAELWTDRRLVEDMRLEMQRMRALLEDQLPGLAWGALGSQHPDLARLIRRCVTAGLSPALAHQLVNDLPAGKEQDQWLACLQRLSQRLACTGDVLSSGGGWQVLLGPTGAGKTTLAVKLATREVLAGRGDRLTLVGLDHRRVGAAEQLRAYARVLGLSVHEPAGVEDLLRLAEGLGPEDRVLVDTAGLLPGAPLPAWMGAVAEQGCRVTPHVVMAAPTDRDTLNRLVRQVHAAGIRSCMLSKLDEAVSLGPVVSTIAEHGLAMSYFGTGPRIPDDLVVATADRLVGELLTSASVAETVRDLDLKAEAYARYYR
jgi:flagellar biosynthesis protein FlhF